MNSKLNMYKRLADITNLVVLAVRRYGFWRGVALLVVLVVAKFLFPDIEA